MIYFIACGDLVKIGTASNARTRLASLQTGNPEPLALLAEIPGGKPTEHDLHQLFYQYRVRGEWFRYDGELREFVEKAAAAPERIGDIAIPYCLFDGDSAFFGVLDTSGRVCRAYAQASRAVRWSSVGQWWRFGEGWEEGTNPMGVLDPQIERRLNSRTVSCPLRDARELESTEEGSALQRLLRKAREF